MLGTRQGAAEGLRTWQGRQAGMVLWELVGRGVIRGLGRDGVNPRAGPTPVRVRELTWKDGGRGASAEAG